jgi:dihydroflavonol-4-reductase
MGEIVQRWAQVTGRRPPLLSIPSRYLTPLTPLVAALGAVVPLPPLISKDSVAILEATYIARSDKARRELGWEPRPLEEALRDTFRAIETRPAGQPITLTPSSPTARLALGLGLAALLLWLLRPRRR